MAAAIASHTTASAATSVSPTGALGDCFLLLLDSGAAVTSQATNLTMIYAGQWVSTSVTGSLYIGIAAGAVSGSIGFGSCSYDLIQATGGVFPRQVMGASDSGFSASVSVGSNIMSGSLLVGLYCGAAGFSAAAVAGTGLTTLDSAGTIYSQSSTSAGSPATTASVTGLIGVASPVVAVAVELALLGTVVGFTSGSGTWTQPAGISTFDLLEVAGGGGTGNALGTDWPGGGGAGGVVTTLGISGSAGSTNTWLVGAGGPGSAGSNSSGTVGANTTFQGATTAVGGGIGGGGFSQAGGAGGSGGGAGGAAGSSSGGAGTAGQGNAGGNSPGGSNHSPGGGGGAGAAGVASVTTNVAGAGGIGIFSSLSGAPALYGGGGGGCITTGGAGGLGGGGAGANLTGNGTSGTANTGGGGGGGGENSGNSGGAGGSGVIYIMWYGGSPAGGLFLSSLLNGLGAGGPFFRNPIG